ncbi:MAG TPA: hypothetical protein VF173_07840 [Thermoanaerobaculia bacterium]|nr:hypothetical protein [Thermoanaerobaculia bacterium]
MPTAQRTLAHLKPLGWDLLGLISALIGISVLVLGASILVLSADDLFSLIVFLPKKIGETLSLFGQLFVWLVFGVCVSRYLRRIDPLRLEPGKPVRAAWLKVSIIVAYTAFLLSPGNKPDMQRLLALAAWLPIGASLFERYVSKLSPVDEPFVLFLRGFGGLADRSVAPSVLAAIPHGRRIVFLVPRFSGTAQWDPFTLGLSGFRLLQPMRSMPVYISATAEQWVEVVRDLIRRAETIVIDLSRDSSAIRTELQLIVSEGRMREAVLIDPEEDSPAEAILQAQFPASSEAPFLRWRYRKTWLRGSLRMLGGIALISVVIALLAIMLPAIVPWLPSRAQENFTTLCLLLFVFPFFDKPLITPDLRRFLARALSASPGVEPPPMPSPRIPAEIQKPSPLLALRIGRQGVTGVYLWFFGWVGIILGAFFSWWRVDLSPFWQTAFQALGWANVIMGALNIAQGVLAVRTRRAGSGWMTTGGSPGPLEAKDARAEIRQTVFREWIKQLADAVEDQVVSAALALTLLTAVCVLVCVPILWWTLLFVVLSFLAFFGLGDFLGSLMARRRLLANLNVARPTDDELRQLLEGKGLKSAREDLELVFIRCRARRQNTPAPLSPPFLVAGEVIGRLQTLEALRTNWWLVLLAGSIVGFFYAMTLEDPWAALLGAPLGLGFGLILPDVKRYFKLAALRRKLCSWQMTLEDHQRLLDYIGQRAWKNKKCQEKCRNVLLLAAARDTAEV